MTSLNFFSAPLMVKLNLFSHYPTHELYTEHCLSSTANTQYYLLANLALLSRQNERDLPYQQHLINNWLKYPRRYSRLNNESKELISELRTKILDHPLLDFNYKFLAVAALNQFQKSVLTVSPELLASLNAKLDSEQINDSKSLFHTLQLLSPVLAETELSFFISNLLAKMNVYEQDVYEAANKCLKFIASKLSTETRNSLARTLEEQINNHNFLEILDCLKSIKVNPSEKALKTLTQNLIANLDGFGGIMKVRLIKGLQALASELPIDILNSLAVKMLKETNHPSNEISTAAIELLGALSARISTDVLQSLTTHLITAIIPPTCAKAITVLSAIASNLAPNTLSSLNPFIKITIHFNATNSEVRQALIELLRVITTIIAPDVLENLTQEILGLLGSFNAEVSVTAIKCLSVITPKLPEDMLYSLAENIVEQINGKDDRKAVNDTVVEWLEANHAAFSAPPSLSLTKTYKQKWMTPTPK